MSEQVLGSALSSLLCWSSALQPMALKSLRNSGRDQQSPCTLLLPELGQEVSFPQGQVRIMNATPFQRVWAVLPVQLELSFYLPPALPV